MNSKPTISALAIGFLANVAFIPLPSYALDDGADVDVDAPGASVEIEADRPGILPRLRGDDPDVDVHVEDPDAGDEMPGTTVEVQRPE
jgi:hypothetical protein